MRRLNKKASEMGGEAVIVWVLVIAVIILGFIFVQRMNLPSFMRNLPGFTGPGEEDRGIDIDLEIAFDCKYPIGKIEIESGRRTIRLLDLGEIKETEFKDIGVQVAKAKPKDYLQLTVHGEILYSEREGNWRNAWNLFSDQEVTLGETEKEIGDDRRPSGWSLVKMSEQIRNFVFNEGAIIIPGLDREPSNPDLKENLRLLYNARYISNPGWICGDAGNIESLKTAEKCDLNCESFGGACITTPFKWIEHPTKEGFLINSETLEEVNKSLELINGGEFFYADESIYNLSENNNLSENRVDYKILKEFTPEYLKELEKEKIIFFVSWVTAYEIAALCPTPGYTCRIDKSLRNGEKILESLILNYPGESKELIHSANFDFSEIKVAKNIESTGSRRNPQISFEYVSPNMSFYPQIKYNFGTCYGIFAGKETLHFGYVDKDMKIGNFNEWESVNKGGDIYFVAEDLEGNKEIRVVLNKP